MAVEILPVREEEAKARMAAGGEGQALMPYLVKGQSRDKAADSVPQKIAEQTSDEGVAKMPPLEKGKFRNKAAEITGAGRQMATRI